MRQFDKNIFDVDRQIADLAEQERRAAKILAEIQSDLADAEAVKAALLTTQATSKRPPIKTSTQNIIDIANDIRPAGMRIAQ